MTALVESAKRATPKTRELERRLLQTEPTPIYAAVVADLGNVLHRSEDET